MLYNYNKKECVYENVTWKVFLLILGVSTIITIFYSLILFNNTNDIRFITEETKAIIIKENQKENEFTPEKLKGYLIELNVRFPHIVYAQAYIETGNFKSHIFKTNHNLFGMKEAKRRPTTNKGTENGHAYYDTWKESVQDYAFYQAAYLNDIKTEAEYLQYLQSNYAEAPNYMQALLNKISDDKKKSLVE